MTQEQQILPKRNRRPVTWMIIYTDAEGRTQFEEVAAKPEVKKFVATIDANKVIGIWRCSDKVQLKTKVVYSI